VSRIEALLELESLLKKRDIANRRRELRFIDENTPKNYSFLFNAFEQQRYEGEKLVSGYKGVVLEGSARSRKTFSALDFLIYICLYVETNCTITIIKETYNEFKTTLYQDFEKLLDEHNLDNPFARLKEIDSFKIRGNKINLIGADQPKKFHGLTSDFVYFNEGLPIDERVFRQATMRCSRMWIIDYNPSVTEHWIFDRVIPRPDVGFLRTTFRDNPRVPLGQKLEIMGYEPWLPGSYEIRNNSELFYNGEPITDKNQPPPHPENVQNGTASVFDWTVYGLGLRGAMQGIIFDNVRWIAPEQFPEFGHIYPIDFGFTTDPCVTGRYAEDENNIWIWPLSYQPIETPEEIAALLETNEIGKISVIPCDSADKYTGENKGTVEMVLGLQNLGYVNAYKISKTKSIMFWLLSMKKKRIHIVKNHLYHHAKKEQENYRMKEINGIMINQPIDKFNHMWDFARYGHMAFNANNVLETEWS
jgi:phage terminase large subunit